MSGCNMDRGRGSCCSGAVSWTLKGKPRPARRMRKWHWDRWVCGVKGIRVGRLQLDQN